MGSMTYAKIVESWAWIAKVVLVVFGMSWAKIYYTGVRLVEF